MNVLLIWLSPEDSAAGAWASTILTGALVLPALRAKMQRQLTLHHAVLVLDFATLSTIASIAAAPMVPIWRVLSKDEIEFQGELEERARGRIILSLALGAQIVLQWVWTVLMLVDPFYTQNACSPETVVVYLAGSQTANEINEKMSGWATWLLLCLSSSLIFGVVMVFSCTSKIHETPVDYCKVEESKGDTLGDIIGYRARCWKHFLYPKGSDDLVERWMIRISQLVALVIVIGFIIISELQIRANQVLSGENEILSFSQGAGKQSGNTQRSSESSKSYFEGGPHPRYSALKTPDSAKSDWSGMEMSSQAFPMNELGMKNKDDNLTASSHETLWTESDSVQSTRRHYSRSEAQEATLVNPEY
ncbi:hypothetical protein FRB90_008964 [Tulasnella sp. 427]|nr:hypothetical protein FRB90_008964 [Tulasnella sp. 427]